MIEIFKGSTSRSTFFMLVDSTTGLGKTGLLYTDMTGSYTRAGSARTSITMVALASASAAWASGGFVEVDATNQPGLYRLDVPNAAYATGVEECVVSLKCASAKTEHKGFILTNWNKQVASIPNAAANASGGLPVLTGTTLNYTLATVTTNTDMRGTDSAYTGTPPTVIQIRTELDSNSTKLANLDAAVSSRSTFAGGTVSGVTNPVTVGTNNDKTGYSIAGTKQTLDVLNDAGAAPAVSAIRVEMDANSTKLGAINTATMAIQGKTGNLPANPAAVGSTMQVDTTQAVPLTNNANTVGDCLNAARADGFGKWSKVGSAITLYAPDGTTPVRIFTLDDATVPTSRT